MRLICAISVSGNLSSAARTPVSTTQRKIRERSQAQADPPQPSPLRSQETADYFQDVEPTPDVPAEEFGEQLAGVVEMDDLPSPVGKLELLENPAVQANIEKAPSLDSGGQECGFFDWTRLPLTDDLPQHIQFTRSIDWASTPLGPMEFWGADLRQMCNLIMASPHPAAMYWGDDLVAVYNEAYIALAGQKHPSLMGQRYRDAWAEVWPTVKDVFTIARQTGQATMKDDDRLFMKRSHYLEETYFSWGIIPMVGADGSVVGLYNPAFEKTNRKIAERRMLTLREVGERTATARDIKGFWKEVELAFGSNQWDTPFALLYSVSNQNEVDSETSSIHSSSVLGSKQCNLEVALGVPKGHSCAPQNFDLSTGMDGFGPVVREALRTEGTLLLRVTGAEAIEEPPSPHNPNGTRPPADPRDLADSSVMEIPTSMLEGIEWRGFGDPCRTVVICPILPTTGESVLGFLILGVNPRRPFDEDYSLFVQLLTRQLATSLAAVVLFEEEIKRGQRAAQLAVLDRIQLSEQLAARTQEARHIETRFTHMAEFSPAGLFIADSDGRITYCNNRWFEISKIPKDLADHWIDYIQENDQEEVRKRWAQMVEDGGPVNLEFRFKTRSKGHGGAPSDTWVLLSAHPEKVSSHTESVFGTITDISAQKWAQGFQKKKMEEAVELKRQQENFIDITSHEMRNPLSAVLQCADEIAASLGEYNTGTVGADKSLITDSISAAETIILCAQHQKRIVDDILTLSKLDSHMLVVAPVDVQPLIILQRSLKMFEAETQNAGITLSLLVDDSFEKLKVDWARLDPQRVSQVLINLLTNAIKFTGTSHSKTASIEVGLSASIECPSAMENPRVQYIPARSQPDQQLMTGEDWGEGEPFYVEYSVKDTGPGLAEEEKRWLFNRFTQASPRTHVQYGGSGLGLFISRELTELQGGEIGVSSQTGKGSTFAFYVKSRRSTQPEHPELGIPANLKSVDAKTRRAEKTPAATPELPTPDASKPKEKKAILVVEDNLVNQKVLQKQLEHRGFTVYVANHGGEALDIICKSTFWKDTATSTRANNEPLLELAAVLMDQEMPIMGGLEATQTIRAWEGNGLLNGHVPIIGVTANARKEQIEALLEAGMDHVVSKPFRMPQLIPKVEELSAKFDMGRKEEMRVS